MLGRRPAASQLAVADHRRREEGCQVDDHQDRGRAADSPRPHEHQGNDRERLNPEHPRVPLRRPPREHQHEGQEIECERDHPEKRRGRNVGADVVGDAEQQTRGDERIQHPGEARARRDRGCVPRNRRGGGPGRCFPNGNDTDEDGHSHQPIAISPSCPLLHQGQRGLDDEGIREQRDQAAEIARRVERIGIAPARGVVVPALQQGRHRR